MIKGRMQSQFHIVYATKDFLKAHNEEIMRSSGMAYISEAPVGNGAQKLHAILFATEEEASAFGDRYHNDVFVDANGNGKPTITRTKHEMPVWSDWYRDRDWRSWWKTPQDQLLDRVTMDMGDYEKLLSAFEVSTDERKMPLSQILEDRPLEDFALEIKDYWRIEYKMNGNELRVDVFGGDDGKRHCTVSIVGLRQSEEDPNSLAYKQKIVYISPFLDEKSLDEQGVETYAWTYVIVNWFLKNLPERVEKEEVYVPSKDRTISKKQKKAKKAERVGARHKVSFRTDYSITLQGVTKSQLKKEIKCLCWGVRGHERHYKNGTVIFIKPYRKGKKRNDPNAYVSKDYDLSQSKEAEETKEGNEEKEG